MSMSVVSVKGYMLDGTEISEDINVGHGPGGSAADILKSAAVFVSGRGGLAQGTESELSFYPLSGFRVVRFTVRSVVIAEPAARSLV